MKHSDFVAEGFYYNNGQELVQVDDILEASEGHYYKVTYDANTDEVYLLEAGTHAVKEPEREFLHACYPPLDVSRIPAF